ncbi:MAG TPA: hypothetical protein VGG44_01695, partial [Tepidisphaeraceae bacterium]
AGLLREATRWAERFEKPLMAGLAAHLIDRSADRVLRVGYVSADFREHPVGRFLLPLLRHHNPQCVQAFCYSNAIRADEMTARLKKAATAWRETAALSDADFSRVIRDDRIDILVDLSSHTAGNRLRVFAQKPAPVQITWLGYPGTTGLAGIDYRLTDPYLDPFGQNDGVYTEKSIRLPNCFWCYEGPENGPPVGDLPASKSHYITFGCLNHFTKVSAGVLDLWARLLAEIPSSRLMIHTHRDNHRKLALRRFADAGVAADRITFVGRKSIDSYFAAYDQIDVALDPFPYGGGATTCDALWMGVPTITLRGRTAVGRGGASLLSNVGLPQFIAADLDEYIAIAKTTAGDTESLRHLRGNLRARMLQSPLMDAEQFARDMEAAFRTAWLRFISA